VCVLSVFLDTWGSREKKMKYIKSFSIESCTHIHVASKIELYSDIKTVSSTTVISGTFPAV